MIVFSQLGHWYQKDGTPQHDADLRRARKEFLLASVTSIDKDMFKNEALERYKMDCLAEAAFENMKQPHESVDDYAKRIFEISLEKSKAAAEFGNKMHDAIDKTPLHGNWETSVDLAPFIAKFVEWQEENVLEVLASEQVVVDLDLGVAGRMDRRIIHKVHGRVTLDFKTQGVKMTKTKVPRKDPGFYDSFARQLAFYEAAECKRDGTFPQLGNCLSVVIDSTEPSAPYEKLWSPQEIASAYEDFVIAAYRWHKKRGYWPVGQWNLCDKLNIVAQTNPI